MKKRQSFQFQIKPNGEQKQLMQQFAGNARKVWNLMLARQQENHAAGMRFSNSFDMNAWLLSFKTSFPYLKISPAQTLQQVTKDLERAFQNFFEHRAQFPQFKQKNRRRDSFRYPQGYQLEEKNNRIFLPKLGWINYRNSRAVIGKIKNVTVSRILDKWTVSIQTECEVEQPIAQVKTAVGIDMGIVRFATLSDGTYIPALNSFKRHQIRLARYQRRMSRKVKFSRNWTKAKYRVQKIHHAIAQTRKDFLHKASTTISKNHACVCVEDLQIKNMSRSSQGSSEQPGKKVKQKSALNRSILDQGWGEFRRQLAYKIAWEGGIFLTVAAHHTSQTCPCCDHVSKDNRTTQAHFACVICGYTNHADVVGAINILERGHRLLACGEPMQLGRSMKQEPTEVTYASA